MVWDNEWGKFNACGVFSVRTTMLEFFLLDCGLAIVGTLYFIYYLETTQRMPYDEHCI